MSSPRNPASEYREKARKELERLSSPLVKSGLQRPFGDPLRGVLVLVEAPAGPRVLDALEKSLAAVNLPDALVAFTKTFTGTDSLDALLRLSEPHLVVAIGEPAADELDALDNPLILKTFATAKPGVPFAWKRNTTGLSLPPVQPALDDETLKKEFWVAFRNIAKLA